MRVPRLSVPGQVEDDIWEKAERARIRREATKSAVTAEQAERMQQLVREHWWMPPRVSWGLARQGASDEAVKAASMSIASQKSRGDIGDRRRPKNKKRAPSSAEEVLASGGGGYAGIGHRTRHEGGFGFGDVIDAVSDVSKVVNPLDPRSSLGRVGFVAEQIGKIDEDIGRQPIIATGSGRVTVSTPRENLAETADVARPAVSGAGQVAAGVAAPVAGAGRWVGEGLYNAVPDLTLPGSASRPSRPVQTREQSVGGGKAAVRAAAVVAETPLQEVQALVKATVAGGVPGSPEWMDAYSKINTSTGRIALDDILNDRTPDLGSGFFPGGKVREQYERESASLKFPGTNESVTLGRWATRSFVEPGSTEYAILSGVIDAGFALGADPVSWATAGAGKGLSSRRLFMEAGGVTGLRNTVLPERVNQFWSTRGRELAETFIRRKTGNEAEDFYMLWKATQKSTGEGIPARLAVAAQRSENADEFIEVMRPASGGLDTATGTTMREKPSWSDLRLKRRPRITEMMPGDSIPKDDVDEAVRGVDRWLANIKADQSTRAEFTWKMATASTRTRKEEVVEEMARAAWTKLEDAGRNVTVGNVTVGTRPYRPAELRRLTSIFGERTEAERIFALDVQTGDNMLIRGAVIGADGKPLASPHALVEYTNGDIPLPDARALRRATAFLGRLERTRVKVGDKTLGLEGPTHVYEFGEHVAIAFQSNIWKPSALWRSAYIIRVVGEEQMRIAVNGMRSMANHPISMLAIVLGQSERHGVKGESIDDLLEAGGALYSTATKSGWVGDNAAVTIGRQRFKKIGAAGLPDNGYWDAWADMLTTAHADDLYRATATQTVDELVDEMMTGRLGWYRRELLADKPWLDTREGVRGHVEEAVARVQGMTNGNPDLLNLVATGKLGDVPLFKPGGLGSSLPEHQQINRRVVSRLEEYTDDAPPVAQGPKEADGGMRATWDRVVDLLMAPVVTKPSNWWSRSPTGKQAYWRRVEEVIQGADPDTQAKILAAAVTEKVPRGDIARMRKLAAKASGELTLDDVSMLAGEFAVKEVKRLLYDMTSRSQFFDAARLIFPFGEAFREMATIWPRLLARNPRAIRRLQMGMEAFRGDAIPNVAGVNPYGTGFFHTNENGEEVFAFPFSQAVTEFTTGSAVPMIGRVAGLSLLTELTPSVGPVVQVPAALWLPDKPEWDGVREFLFPFGEPEIKEGLIEAFAPSWARNVVRQGMGFGRDDKAWMNTVADAQRRLYSDDPDKYDLSTVAGANKLNEDGMKLAKALYMVRGLGSLVGFAPSAPTPEWVVKDKTGRLQVTQMLATKYREYQEDDYETATQRMLEEYGPQVFLVLASKSTPIVYGVPTSKDGEMWVRKHPHLKKEYPYVYGFFAPQGGEFDIQVYNRAFDSGELVPNDPKVQIRMAQHAVASMVYDQAKRQVGAKTSDEEAAWLSRVREGLRKEYPGFRDYTGQVSSAGHVVMIDQVQKAIANPEIADTPNGRSAATYLAKREEAKAAVEAAGFRWNENMSSAKPVRPLRDWLRNVAADLIADNPDFKPMWDMVFSREIPDEGEEEG